MALQHRLDLPQLDAEAADLDLMVDAPQVVELAVLAITDEVAGGVHPLSRADREGVGKEAGSGQVRPPQIAAGQPGAGQVELAGLAVGHPLQVAVEQISPLAVEQVADRGGRESPGTVSAQVEKVVSSEGP